MELDATTYLASKGLQVFKANGNEVTTHCVFCPDGDVKGKGKLYLNVDSWLYECKRCGESGNRRTLLRHFGDTDDVAYLPGSDPMARRRVLEESADLAAEMLLANPDVLAYLRGRGLSIETILNYKIGYVPRSWSLTGSLPGEHHRQDLIASGMMTADGKDFHWDKVTIPYLQRGSCVQIRGKQVGKGGYFTPSGDAARLFNADRLAGAETVIVTEGEFDCLVLQQLLETSLDPKVRATAVVGIPGANALPAGFEGYFVEAKRVFIALDPDDVGKKAALKMKELLGSKARIVSLPEDLPKCDWSEAITVRKMGLNEVLEMLGTSAGRRLWSVADAAVKWHRKSTEAPGMATGFAEIDAWFKPGLEAGDLIIALAKTGTGKTNFCANIAYNVRMRPTLFISLEMMASQVYERLRKIHHFWNPLDSDQAINEGYANLRLVDENRLREGDIYKLCEEYDEEMGYPPQLVVVDYLGYYAKGCKGGSPYERVSNAVMSLKEEAKAAEVALLSPAQVGRVAQDGKPLDADSARDSGVIEETADLLVSLYRPDDAIEATKESVPSGLVRAQNLKSRKGQSGMSTNLMFSAASLVLVDANTDAAKMCAEENRFLWRGHDYEEVRAYRRNEGYASAQLELIQGGRS